MTEVRKMLLSRNLKSVFGERNSALRASAITALYTEDCVFYEADGEVRGQAALNLKVQGLLDGALGFVFTAVDGPDRVQDMERLSWALGPAGGHAVAKGTDIALIFHGRIQSLYTFIADVAD